MAGIIRRVAEIRYLGLDLLVRAMERLAGHRRGEHLDFHLSTSARDLLIDKRQALRTELEGLRLEASALRAEVEAVAQSLARAGASHPEDALRAVRALRSSLREQLSPETVQRLVSYLPEPDAARLRELLRVELNRPRHLQHR